MDRDKFFLADDGCYGLLSIKGEGYKHEREVRLIAKSPAFVKATNDGASPSLEEITALVTQAPPGFNLLLDLQRLIAEIRICAFADDVYLDEVQRAIAGKSIPASIVQHSELKS